LRFIVRVLEGPPFQARKPSFTGFFDAFCFLVATLVATLFGFEPKEEEEEEEAFEWKEDKPSSILSKLSSLFKSINNK